MLPPRLRPGIRARRKRGIPGNSELRRNDEPRKRIRLPDGVGGRKRPGIQKGLHVRLLRQTDPFGRGVHRNLLRFRRGKHVRIRRNPVPWSLLVQVRRFLRNRPDGFGRRGSRVEEGDSHGRQLRPLLEREDKPHGRRGALRGDCWRRRERKQRKHNRGPGRGGIRRRRPRAGGALRGGLRIQDGGGKLPAPREGVRGRPLGNPPAEGLGR